MRDPLDILKIASLRMDVASAQSRATTAENQRTAQTVEIHALTEQVEELTGALLAARAELRQYREVDYGFDPTVLTAIDGVLRKGAG